MIVAQALDCVPITARRFRTARSTTPQLSRTCTVCTQTAHAALFQRARSGEKIVPFEGVPRHSTRAILFTAPVNSKWILSAFICVYLRLAVPLLAQNAELSGRISDPAVPAVPGPRLVPRSQPTAASPP